MLGPIVIFIGLIYLAVGSIDLGPAPDYKAVPKKSPVTLVIASLIILGGLGLLAKSHGLFPGA